MPKLRVGIADTLEARTLAWGLLKGHHADLFETVSHPVELIGRLLEQGGVDVALASSIEAARLEGLQVLPDLCLAFPGKAGSLLLVSRSPLEEVDRVVRTWGGPTASAALSIVLAERYGTRPEEVASEPSGLSPRGAIPRLADLAAGEAVLLGGGDALRAGTAGYLVLDLGAAWHELTGLPLVVGVWAVRQGVHLPELPFYFKSSLRYGLSSLGAIAREAAAELAVDSVALERYLRDAVSYFLRDQERRGLEDLFRRAAHLGLVPERRLKMYEP